MVWRSSWKRVDSRLNYQLGDAWNLVPSSGKFRTAQCVGQGSCKTKQHIQEMQLAALMIQKKLSQDSQFCRSLTHPKLSRRCLKKQVPSNRNVCHTILLLFGHKNHEFNARRSSGRSIIQIEHPFPVTPLQAKHLCFGVVSEPDDSHWGKILFVSMQSLSCLGHLRHSFVCCDVCMGTKSSQSVTGHKWIKVWLLKEKTHSYKVRC